MPTIQIPGLEEDEIRCLFAVSKTEYMKSPRPSDMQFDWFFNSAYLGLIDAKKRVDKTNPKWKSFLSFRMKGAIKDALRNYDEVPRSMRKIGGVPNKIYFSDVDRSKTEQGDGKHKLLADEILGIEAPEIKNRDHSIWKVLTRTFGHETTLILRLYYAEGMFMSEVGKVVGYSESRISQIIKQHLPRIKHVLRNYNSKAA